MGICHVRLCPRIGTFTPANSASKPPQRHDAKCGAACHRLAASKDYIFTAYAKRKVRICEVTLAPSSWAAIRTQVSRGCGGGKHSTSRASLGTYSLSDQ